ncbi:hypothetical protein LSPH26S_02237 [Lysinibacillus sphaericus]
MTITPTGTSNNHGEITKLFSITSSVVSIFSEFMATSAKLLPINPNATSVMINAGIVVYSICFIWSNKSVFVKPAARFVVSDKGDILSPKYEPEITAPAIIGAGIPILKPIPIPATPIVAIVDHELPIASETIEHNSKIVTKNQAGEINFKP